MIVISGTIPDSTAITGSFESWASSSVTFNTITFAFTPNVYSENIMNYGRDNLLTLTEWSDIIGPNPWLTHQIGIGFSSADIGNRGMSRGKVQGVMFEHAYQQSEHLGRDEIEHAIAIAEQMIAGVIGFWPRPKYTESEQVMLPTYYNMDYHGAWQTPRGNSRKSKLERGRVLSVGTETLTLAESGVALTRLDLDGDGIDETFTATATVPSGTVASEVVCFFTAADRNNADLRDWQIRPVTVSVDGTTAVITGKAWLLVKPDLRERVNPSPLDVADVNTYVTEIDVYRRTTNLGQAGQLQWNDLSLCNSPPCGVYISSACFRMHDFMRGVFDMTPATYNEASASFSYAYPTAAWRFPDRAVINYLSGYPAQSNGWMDYTLARIVAFLATALLPNKTSGVERADQRLQYYRQAPDVVGSQASDVITSEQLNTNLFPSVNGRGAFLATAMIYNSRLLRMQGFSAHG